MSKSDKKRANSTISKRVWQGNREYTVHGIGTLILYMDKTSAVCNARAMGHGYDQRICDAAALSRDPDTGKSATPQEKYEAMKRLVDHYNSGSDVWEIRAPASPGVDAGLTLQAIMRALGKTLEEAEALIAATQTKRGVDRAGALKIWADAKQVAQAILDIKRERAAGGADAADLEAEMMADEVGPDEDEAPF